MQAMSARSVPCEHVQRGPPGATRCSVADLDSWAGRGQEGQPQAGQAAEATLLVRMTVSPRQLPAAPPLPALAAYAWEAHHHQM